MIEIIQSIIDLLNYTPTFYVDGMVGEVQGAWIGAAIGAVASLVGGTMSANASASSAKQLKKAAKKNYNMLMENAEMSKMTLNEQMDRYEEDMESYKSSMIQRYGLAGGIRANDAGLKEVADYQFDTDEIDKDALRETLEAKRLEKIDDYVANATNRYLALNSGGSSEAGHEALTEEEAKAMFRKQAEKKYDESWTDQQVTEALGTYLKDYKGKQTDFYTKPQTSAILNLQTSVSNMQKDINAAYKEGMINYWQQRKNAQNVKDTLQTQAIGYSTQAQTTLASGFLSAIGYGAQAYSQYKSGR